MAKQNTSSDKSLNGKRNSAKRTYTYRKVTKNIRTYSADNMPNIC